MVTKRKRPIHSKSRCKRCCCRRTSRTEKCIMGTIGTGARVVVAAGMLGAISDCVDRD